MYIFNSWPRVFRSSICPNLKIDGIRVFLYEISFFSDKLLFFVSIIKNDPPYLVGLIHFKSKMVDCYSFFLQDNLIDKEKSWKFCLRFHIELAVGSGEDIVLGRNLSHSTRYPEAKVFF